ncbi:MAG: lysozyme [Pseudomonadota bacterium]
MKILKNGIDLIKRFEGLELEAYQDVAGVWTIGYGCTDATHAFAGNVITEAEAEFLLRRDLERFEKAVARGFTVRLNQNEFDALVSITFNIGIGGMLGSTFRRRINQGQRIRGADAMLWWNKAKVNGRLREINGLTRRRNAERGLFLTPFNPRPDFHRQTNAQPLRETRPLLPRLTEPLSYDPFRCEK